MFGFRTIRQVLIITTLVGIGITIGFPIYRLLYPKTVYLPTPLYLLENSPEDTVKQIKLDLALGEADLNLLELTPVAEKRQGIYEEAIVSSVNSGRHTVRYVYHNPTASDPDARRWRIKTNYVTTEDGTGAGDLAIKEFDLVPTAEQIAEIRARFNR